MLPRAADALRERIGRGNLGLRDPRSIVQRRNVPFSMFGGKVPLRPGTPKPGERPNLIARVGLNRSVLLQGAASAARCLESGSGGGSLRTLQHISEPCPRCSRQRCTPEWDGYRINCNNGVYIIEK